MFLYGLIPKDTSWRECITCLLNDIRALEKGYKLKVNGTSVFVTGALGSILTDLPQGAEVLFTLAHGATIGCRVCFLAKSDWSNLDV
jgi:hypothetical protein